MSDHHKSKWKSIRGCIKSKIRVGIVQGDIPSKIRVVIKEPESSPQVKVGIDAGSHDGVKQNGEHPSG